MSKSKDRFFWKITDDTDWDSFQNYLESSFTADWVNKNNDINTLWSFWKFTLLANCFDNNTQSIVER
jgi:hypothetical protein